VSRKVGNWLLAYKEYTSESESPETYHLFCGLSAISSAIRRGTWLDQGIYLLFPNIFAVLVGPPGRCGKSTAIRMARTLLYAVPGVNIGPDSVTREELIKRLAQSYSDGQSALTIHSTELSSLIEPSGIKMIQFLTDIYDCDYANPSGWQYATKGQGKDEIKDPFVTLLAATTPTYVADGLPENVVSHGFAARVIFIYEEQERFSNPFPKEPSGELIVALTEDLVTISQLKGQFRWTDEGRKTYKEFYDNLQVTQPDDYRLEGFHWRKRTHVLKLAMLCSLSEKDDLILTAEDIIAAHDIIKLVEPKMARTFTAVGKFEYASDLERIQAQLIRAGKEGIEIGELLRMNYYVGDVRTLDSMISGLVVMNSAVKDKRGDKVFIVSTTHRAIWEH